MAQRYTIYTGSKSSVKKAGKVLRREDASPDERSAAIKIANAWRSSHGRPANHIAINTRNHIKRLGLSGIVARRLKRLPSIEAKLRRFPNSQLDTIQDLGGVRAILTDVDAVRAVERGIRESRAAHELKAEDDYLANPKPSGYRGIHLVYAYRSSKNPGWNGLRVEIQLRTKLQHTWATAVETVELFTQQALKASIGDERWLLFFKAVSSEMAWMEGLPLVPGIPEDLADRRDLIRRLAAELDVERRFEGFTGAVQFVDERELFDRDDTRAPYWMLVLDTTDRSLTLSAFADEEVAARAYAGAEADARETEGIDVVLVNASDLETLRNAYPNYFADTKAFLRVVTQITHGHTNP